MPPKIPTGWVQYNLVWPEELRREVDIYRATNGLKDMREATLQLIRKGLEAEKQDKT